VIYKYSGDKIPNGNTIMSFGKYKDKLTFSELYEKNPGYFNWFVGINDASTDTNKKNK